MGLKKFINKLFGKKEEKPPKRLERKMKEMEGPKYFLIAEAPKKRIMAAVGHTFLNKKLENKEKLSEELKKHKTEITYAVQKPATSKSKRIKDIREAYDRIKIDISGRPKVILLHNYIDEAIGENLKKDFPYLEVFNMGYPRNYSKFKKKVKKAIPLYFVKKEL